jgi:hypothetical protein
MERLSHDFFVAMPPSDRANRLENAKSLLVKISRDFDTSFPTA